MKPPSNVKTPAQYFDSLPADRARTIATAISSEEWIEMYEQSRLKTKAGQAHMAKQGATTPSEGAAEGLRHKAPALKPFRSQTVFARDGGGT